MCSEWGCGPMKQQPFNVVYAGITTGSRVTALEQKDAMATLFASADGSAIVDGNFMLMFMFIFMFMLHARWMQLIFQY